MNQLPYCSTHRPPLIPASQYRITGKEECVLCMFNNNKVVSFVGKVKPCPKCGDILYYIPQVKGWSHIRTDLDIEEKYCHYNETEAKS